MQNEACLIDKRSTPRCPTRHVTLPIVARRVAQHDVSCFVTRLRA